MNTTNMLARRAREEGKVGMPILLWILGAPLPVVLLVWFFFFRG